MGLFGGFFERRRQRESAVAEGFEAVSTPPPADVEPVGQPIADVGQPLSLNVSQPADIGSMLSMIGAAMQSGQFQIQQTDEQVIDLRGSGLRDEIMEAMRQAGVDPEAQGEIDAAQYGDLQNRILEALSNHGVDVTGGRDIPPAPDADGDGRPG